MPTRLREDERSSVYAETAALVRAARGGDETAFGRLYDRWFDSVFDVACRITRDPDDAAAIAQDTFLTAWRKLDTLADPQAFPAWLLRVARNSALTHVGKMRRSRPVDSEGMCMIEASHVTSGHAPDGFTMTDHACDVSQPERAAEDADLSAIVWESAASLGERDATVLDLHLRQGFTPSEIAASLGVTRNNANQLLYRLRNRLGTSVRARMLWHGGEPACHALSMELARAGITRFDADAVRLIQHHVDSCESCCDRQLVRVSPAALFSAIPVMVAAPAVRAAGVRALQDLGVPMQGSRPMHADSPDIAHRFEDSPEDGDLDSDFGAGAGARDAAADGMDASAPDEMTDEGDEDFETDTASDAGWHLRLPEHGTEHVDDTLHLTAGEEDADGDTGTDLDEID